MWKLASLASKQMNSAITRKRAATIANLSVHGLFCQPLPRLSPPNPGLGTPWEKSVAG